MLSSSPDYGKIGHRDELLPHLLKLTGNTSSSRVPSALRKNPSLFFDCFMNLRPKAAAMIKKEEAELKGGDPPSGPSPSGASPAPKAALADREGEAGMVPLQDKAPPSKVKTLKAGHFIHQFCGYIYIFIYVYGSYYMTYMNT